MWKVSIYEKSTCLYFICYSKSPLNKSVPTVNSPNCTIRPQVHRSPFSIPYQPQSKLPILRTCKHSNGSLKFYIFEKEITNPLNSSVHPVCNEVKVNTLLKRNCSSSVSVCPHEGYWT